MTDASTIYTLTAEAAAARCRELLTTATPPPAGRALEDRKDQPPSIIVEGKVPYKRRMWSPAGVDKWCAERQSPRMRKAFACLARLEDLLNWSSGEPVGAAEKDLDRRYRLILGENEP